MMGSLDCMSGNDRSRLIGEQVHRVRGMMPQQMVGPGSRLPLGVDVLASEEIRLDVHLLEVELASADLALELLVRRVEPAGGDRNGAVEGQDGAVGEELGGRGVSKKKKTVKKTSQ